MFVGLVPLGMAARTIAPVFRKALAMEFFDVDFFVLDIVVSFVWVWVDCETVDTFQAPQFLEKGVGNEIQNLRIRDTYPVLDGVAPPHHDLHSVGLSSTPTRR